MSNRKRKSILDKLPVKEVRRALEERLKIVHAARELATRIAEGVTVDRNSPEAQALLTALGMPRRIGDKEPRA